MVWQTNRTWLNDTQSEVLGKNQISIFRFRLFHLQLLLSSSSVFFLLFSFHFLHLLGKIFFHATMNTKWCTFPLETLLNSIQSINISLKCVRICGRVYAFELFGWSMLLLLNITKPKNETDEMHIMVDGTFVSNSNVYDIDTMWNENRERLLHTCDEVDVCWTLCKYNHVVYIILYLLVVCNRDDK